MTVYLERLGESRDLGMRTWNRDDAMLYALAVGCGPGDLKYVTENTTGVEQQVLPTFVTVVERRPHYRELGDFRLSQLLQVGQSVSLRSVLPVSGSLRTISTVVEILDKGTGALIVTENELVDEKGRVVAVTRRSLFVKGAGGFGGPRGGGSSWRRPAEEPDRVLTLHTVSTQALLYRLTGDRNPLHSDDTAARKAGFERPILHGLCTYGMVGRELLRHVCDDDVAAFGSMTARFAAPVFPGETITVQIWDTAPGALFEARVGDRLVLSSGVFERR